MRTYIDAFAVSYSDTSQSGLTEVSIKTNGKESRSYFDDFNEAAEYALSLGRTCMYAVEQYIVSVETTRELFNQHLG
jgi:hypothetical protein